MHDVDVLAPVQVRLAALEDHEVALAVRVVPGEELVGRPFEGALARRQDQRVRAGLGEDVELFRVDLGEPPRSQLPREEARRARGDLGSVRPAGERGDQDRAAEARKLLDLERIHSLDSSLRAPPGDDDLPKCTPAEARDVRPEVSGPHPRRRACEAGEPAARPPFPIGRCLRSSSLTSAKRERDPSSRSLLPQGHLREEQRQDEADRHDRDGSQEHDL